VLTMLGFQITHHGSIYQQLSRPREHAEPI
jgi:hypothetical protein